MYNLIPDDYYPNFYYLDGTHSKNLLFSYKFINKNYNILGAKRLDKVIQESKKNYQPNIDQNTILFTSGWHDAETLFGLMIFLANKVEQKFIFSYHPKISKSLINSFNSRIKKANLSIRLIKGNASKYFAQSNYVITTYSTSGLESVMYNTPCLIYNSRYSWNFNLFDFENIENFTFNEDELIDFLNNNSKDLNMRNKILKIQSKYVKELFTNF